MGNNIERLIRKRERQANRDPYQARVEALTEEITGRDDKIASLKQETAVILVSQWIASNVPPPDIEERRIKILSEQVPHEIAKQYIRARMIADSQKNNGNNSRSV